MWRWLYRRFFSEAAATASSYDDHKRRTAVFLEAVLKQGLVIAAAGAFHEQHTIITDATAVAAQAEKAVIKATTTVDRDVPIVGHDPNADDRDYDDIDHL